MGRLQDQYPALLALAHDRSEGARLQLAGKIADICLNTSLPLSANEEELVNDLIDQLLKNQSPAVRQELLKKFTDATHMPRKMAVSLAHDSIEIARAILLSNVTLTDEDLVLIVETQTSDHACAVAARRQVSEAVADALVTTGDLRVMQTVAENLGAKLSQRAVTILTEAARLAAPLQKPILERPELTAEAATKLYWWVTQDLRRLALQRFGIAAGQLDLALAKAIEDKLNEHVLERFDSAAMEAAATWLEERDTANIHILPKLLRMGHFRLFNIILGRLSQLDVTLIDCIVDENGGRMLAALCRSLNIDKASFVSIFLLSRGARADEQIVHPRELSRALAAYDRVPVNVAQDMVTSWRTNPGYVLHRADTSNDDEEAVEA